jgi:hypothetical protein
VDRLDFELGIHPDTGAGYAVTVQSAAAGEARGVLRLPFDSAGLTDRLQKLEIALLSGGPGRRRMVSPGEEVVRGLGQALFDALFTGDVRAAYDVARHDAVRQGVGLRVKLKVEAPALGAVPWEYLYDARRAEYLCLSRTTPVVRYLEISEPQQALEVASPLRILGVVASPTDLPALDVAKERQQLEVAVAGLVERGAVELEWLERPTWRELQRALRAGPWHLLHFVGHAGFDEANGEGLIVLLDEHGRADRVQAVNLGRLLGDHFPLRLAVLNACEGARGDSVDLFSSAAATLVRRGTPAVLAMQFQITDVAAIELARSFYEGIADGLPVDSALTEARQAVCLAIPGTLEWGVPVLYTHAADGRLFELSPTAGARPAGPPPPAASVSPPSPPPPRSVPSPTPPTGPTPDSPAMNPTPPTPPTPPRKRWLVGVAVVVVLAAVAAGALLLRPDAATSADFGGAGATELASAGVVVTRTAARMTVALPDAAGRKEAGAPAASDAQPTPEERGGIRLACRLEGDFAVEVSYQLDEWSEGNQGRIGLLAGMGVIRIGDPEPGHADLGSDRFLLDPGDAVPPPQRQLLWGPVAHGDGALRLTRTGTRYVASARRGGGSWEEVASHDGEAISSQVYVQLWGPYSPGARKVTFSDLRISSGSCS